MPQDIPTFDYPDAAARAFCMMWRYSRNLDALYETPALTTSAESIKAQAKKIINQAAERRTGRLLPKWNRNNFWPLTAFPLFGQKLRRARRKPSTCQKRSAAPSCSRFYSKTITHKSDVGGVKLNLRGPAAVRRAYREIEANCSGGLCQRIARRVSQKRPAEPFLGVTVQPMIPQSRDGYELILGSSIDPQFGPVLLFGAGGYFVEIFKDRALGLPPLNRTLARRLMERTHIHAAFKGFRGRSAIDQAALEELLVRFSQLVIEQRRIKEIDINPLVVSVAAILALDARIVLHDARCAKTDLPRSTIRPYPAEYITTRKIGGVEVTIRPIRPEDEPLMVEFHRTLSDRSVHFRYLGSLSLQERTLHRAAAARLLY